MFEFSDKDQIKLQLSIIHANTDKITENKLADIRANIQYKWANNLNFIDNLKEINEQRKYAEINQTDFIEEKQLWILNMN